MAYQYKIGEIRGEESDGVFRAVRVTARGRKTVAKADTDNEEYSQPEAFLLACEEWLDLVGKQGWQLADVHHLGDMHVRYTLQKSEAAPEGAAKEKKDKTITQELTEQVAGKAVKSVLKIP